MGYVKIEAGINFNKPMIKIIQNSKLDKFFEYTCTRPITPSPTLTNPHWSWMKKLKTVFLS